MHGWLEEGLQGATGIVECYTVVGILIGVCHGVLNGKNNGGYNYQYISTHACTFIMMSNVSIYRCMNDIEVTLNFAKFRSILILSTSTSMSPFPWETPHWYLGAPQGFMISSAIRIPIPDPPIGACTRTFGCNNVQGYRCSIYCSFTYTLEIFFF